MQVALVHDYLTQRGGAERVVLSLTRAFPGAPVYTSLYDPGGTFPEFADLDVRTLPINRLAPLRRHHRAALPLLAPSFSRLRISADVVICSSSGWAHGTQVEGKKIVYCHTPARWLYQPDRYLRGRGRPLQAAASVLRSTLERWDKRAASVGEHLSRELDHRRRADQVDLRHRREDRAAASGDDTATVRRKRSTAWNPASCSVSLDCCRTRTSTP